MYEHCKIQLLDSERYRSYFVIFFLQWNTKLAKQVTNLNIKYNMEIIFSLTTWKIIKSQVRERYLSFLF